VGENKKTGLILGAVNGILKSLRKNSNPYEGGGAMSPYNREA